MKPVYIAAYHQSEFGKLMGMTVPDIVKNAIYGACKVISVEPSAIVLTTTTLYFPPASNPAIFSGGQASTSTPIAFNGRTT